MSESKGTSSLGSKEEKMKKKKKKNSDTEEEEEEEPRQHLNGGKVLQGKDTSAALNIHDQRDENTSQTDIKAQFNAENFLFRKSLSLSDVCLKSSMLIIPKEDAETHFPHIRRTARKQEFTEFRDDKNRQWFTILRYYESHDTYAIACGWFKFLRNHRYLQEGDVVEFYKPDQPQKNEYYLIRCKKAEDQTNEQGNKQGGDGEQTSTNESKSEGVDAENEKAASVERKKMKLMGQTFTVKVPQGDESGEGKSEVVVAEKEKAASGERKTVTLMGQTFRVEVPQGDESDEGKSKGVNAENEKEASVERKTVTLMGQTFTVKVSQGDESGEGKSKGVNAENEKAASVERKTVTLMGQTLTVEVPQEDESGEGSKTMTLIGQTFPVEVPQGDESGEGKPKKIWR